MSTTQQSTPQPLPAQQAPTRQQRRGMSTGGIVAIVLGSVVGGFILIMAILFVVFAVATNGGTTSSSSIGYDAPQSAPLPSNTYGSGATAAPEEAPTPAPIPAWGAPLTIGQGITATSSKPRSYRPGPYTNGAEGSARVVKVDITVQNNSTHYLNFSNELYNAQYLGGASTPGVQDFSAKQTIGYPPNEAIAPGRAVTYSLAWAIPTNEPTPIGVDLKAVGNGYIIVGSWSGMA